MSIRLKVLATVAAVLMVIVSSSSAWAVNRPAGWSTRGLNQMIAACEADNTQEQIDNYCRRYGCSTTLRQQMNQVCQELDIEAGLDPDADVPPPPFATLPEHLYVLADSSVDEHWPAHRSDDNWVDLMEHAGVKSHHLAQNGQTAKNALNMQAYKVIKYLSTAFIDSPVEGKHAVIVSLFGNDSWIHGDLAGFTIDFRQLMARVTEQVAHVDADVYCLLPFMVDNYGPYAEVNPDGSTVVDHMEAVVAIADEGGCTLIDTRYWPMPSSSFGPDGRHLSKEGHRRAFGYLTGR